MSKLFKILVFLTLICLSCTAIFACGTVEPDDPKEESESISQIESVSEELSEEESEEETESNFEVELPEVDRF